MFALRVAFDVLVQLGVTETEYAGALYAAVSIDDQSPAMGVKLSEAMVRDDVIEIFTMAGANVEAWRSLAGLVRESNVLTTAIRTLALHAEQVPDEWLDELSRLPA